MFVLEDESYAVPIKVWLEGPDKLEDSCKVQAENLARLPFLHKWVALMPDTHTGFGMPIGGVIATKKAIIPNAVGVDIGCGMRYTSTNIKVADIKDVITGNGSLIQAIIGTIMRSVPVGKAKFQKPQRSLYLDNARKMDMIRIEKICEAIDESYYYMGTLGGGNHFIELQEDQDGYLCVMIHSGSRMLGAEICKYFKDIAIENAEKWNSPVDPEAHLDYLPINTGDLSAGSMYLYYMTIAMDFAQENRERMMDIVKDAIYTKVSKFTDIRPSFSNDIDCVHNYANPEEHYGELVWVHRKGAIRIREGELGLIPGAMGSYSYVVEGLGNPETFDSASHGAGRVYSRTAAMDKISVEEVIVDLKNQGIILGKHNKKDVPEESRFAYKDIDEVLAQEADMVKPIKKLKTVGVIKG